MQTLMIIMICLITVAVYSITIAMALDDVDVMSVGCLGFGSMLSVYVVLVGLMAWIDRLNILVALSITGLFGLLVLLILIRLGLRPTVLPLHLTDISPMVILLASLSLVVTQFGVLGMGQDEGVYHTKAIVDVLGSAGNLYEFDEFHGLTDDQQQEYLQFLRNLGGFYNFPHYPTFKPGLQHCPAEGHFHGLPSAGAVYALGYMLFGLENLGVMDVLMYAATGWLIYAFCRRRGWSMGRSTLCLTSFLLSPLVIWVTKSTLTESLLTLFIAMVVYLIQVVKSSHKCSAYLLAVPITGFCFYHVSAFMLMPLFSILLLCKFYDTRDSVFLKVHALCLVSFCLGFYMMLFTAPQYSYDNLSRIYVGPINEGTLWVVPLAYAAVAGLVPKLMVVKSTGLKPFDQLSLGSWAVRATIVLSLLFLVRTILFMASDAGLDDANSLSEFYRGSGDWLLTFQYTPFYATCLFAAPFLLPISVAYCFIKPEKYLQPNNSYILISFIYLVMLCNVFVRREIPYYYYYARYLEYTLPIAILMAGITVEMINVKLAVSLSLAGIIVWMPSIEALTSHQDITEISTADLSEICEAVEPGSAVLFHTTLPLQRAIAVDVKELAQADVYPVFEDVDRQLGDLLDEHQRAYILDEATSGSSGTPSEILTLQASREYNVLHADATSIMPIPLRWGEASYSLSLYDAVEYYWGTSYEAQMAIDGNATHDERGFHIMGGGSLHGPYLAMGSGQWCLTVYVNSDSHIDQPLTVTSLKGKNTLANFTVHEGVNHLELTLDSDAEDVEFVISNEANDDFHVFGPYLQRVE